MNALEEKDPLNSREDEGYHRALLSYGKILFKRQTF